MIVPRIQYYLLKPPFLLEGSSETEFIYKLENFYLNKKNIEELNSSKNHQTLQEIKSRGGLLKFQGCVNGLFRNNLVMIDSKMPQLLSEVILLCCFSGLSKTNDIVDELERKDPLYYKTSNNIKIYRHKFNELLRSIALGLTPETIWYGEPNLYEHMPVFKRGDEIIYYCDDIKRFLDILSNDSLIETTNKFFVYKKGNQSYLNLRFQISFKT